MLNEKLRSYQRFIYTYSKT